MTPAADADEDDADDHHGGYDGLASFEPPPPLPAAHVYRGFDGLTFEPPPPLPAAFAQEILAARLNNVIIGPDDILN